MVNPWPMTLKVGSIVIIKNKEILGNNPGTVGVCYEDYGTGSSFVFENGNYDGFSIQEQKDMLEHIGTDKAYCYYEFTNVLVVTADFRRGLWNFEELRKEFKLD